MIEYYIPFIFSIITSGSKNLTEQECDVELKIVKNFCEIFKFTIFDYWTSMVEEPDINLNFYAYYLHVQIYAKAVSMNNFMNYSATLDLFAALNHFQFTKSIIVSALENEPCSDWLKRGFKKLGEVYDK